MVKLGPGSGSAMVVRGEGFGSGRVVVVRVGEWRGKVRRSQA
jgi:hypothetical protein